MKDTSHIRNPIDLESLTVEVTELNLDRSIISKKVVPFGIVADAALKEGKLSICSKLVSGGMKIVFRRAGLNKEGYYKTIYKLIQGKQW
jgi:hypothetical protein